MLINHLRSPLRFTLKPRPYFSSTKQQHYIPVRPLTQQSNLLFRKADPQSLPFFTKFLAYTPFFAVGLDGFINQWSYLTIGGTAFFLLAAHYSIKLMNFLRSFQVYELRVSKDMKKFYLTLENNQYSYRIEEAILKMENKTFQQKFEEALKARTHNMPQQYYNDLINSTPEQLKKSIKFLRSKREGIIINLDGKYIEKIEFVAKSQMYSALKQNYLQYFRSSPKIANIFQGYTALKQRKEMVILTTKKIKEWNNSPVYFIIRYEQNQEKKLEQYLKALGQGKKIVIDL